MNISKKRKPYAIIDSESRKEKAFKIIKILQEEVDKDLKNKVLLDIGTGSGHMAYNFSKEISKVFSVDVNDLRIEKRNYEYKKVRDEELPFGDSFFDLVVSNHVIEHVNDQNKHIKEIVRVLKPDGYLYLATPNKYWIIDPHTKLPFISWIPNKLADIYSNTFKKGTWDITPLSLITLNQFMKNDFDIKVLSSQIILDLEKYGYKKSRTTMLLSRIPSTFYEMMELWIPTIILVCKKKK